MDSDFAGGRPPRRKPKIVYPLERPKEPTIHELAAKEGHDLNANDAAGPEADSAKAFVHDHTRPMAEKSHGLGNPDEVIEINEDKEQSKEPSFKKSKLAWLKYKLSKKQKVVALVAAVLVIIAAGFTVFEADRHNQIQPIVAAHAITKPKPKPIYSPLTGLPVTQAQAGMPVTGVMIENSLPARPQSGLSQAGIVYEAIAEAGITRFLALYQGEDPTSIGPIRSARPYFVRWALGYSADYAHVGGSPEALSDIKAWGVKDMDQFSNGNYYQRITSRWAPHNVYTSMSDLHSLEQARGYYTTSNFEGFKRKQDTPIKVPTAAIINMNISSPDYAVRYTYDAKTNSYERFEGGKPHMDASTGQQIAPKVVVALIIPFSEGSLDSSGAYYSVYNNIGSGTAYIFQDGSVTEGQWQKTGIDAPLELLDSSGQPIALNRGQTWLTALANSSELTYSP